MRGLWWAAALGLMVTAGGAAAADYHPAFQPSRLKGPPVGPTNQVLVLGTPHLSGLPDTFDPKTLGPLLDRLATFAPQVILVESLSGPQCDFLRRYPGRYRETVEGYCWDPAPARAATGLDVPAATEAADKMLANWPKAPTPADRRTLASLFLAGGEQTSAVVQWLRLPETERKPGDGLDATLVARLNTLIGRRNEDFMIAAPLAARLGLERVYAADDHSADSMSDDDKAAGAAIMKAWDNPASAKRKVIDARLRGAIGTGDGVLAMYRDYNGAEAARLAYESDFGATLKEPSPQRFGRRYLGYWETRNLRMAAYIRDALALQPGSRALMIVGASHKGYLDAYLDQMHDVQLVDTERVLK